MANTLNLGTNGNWATKEDSLLAYNSENGNFKPLPFDFTRATSATVINKDGLIETVGSGEPRIDYKDDSKGSLLLEPSRTNLVTYSQDFSQWNTQGSGTGSQPIITSNNTISPDGNQNADKIVFNKGTGVTVSDLSVISSSSFTSQTNTASFYIKADIPQKIVIRNSTNWQLINVTTEWQRISKTDTGGGIQIGLRDGYGIEGVPNTATVYLWGAQAEQGSYATSYIPTQGGVVTRNQDSCSNAGNEQVINSTEGVLYLEVKALNADAGINRKIVLGDGSYNNGIEFGYQTTNNKMQFIIRSSTGGAGITMNIETTDFDITEFNKIAISYKSNEGKVFVNGSQIGITDTSVVTPTGLSQLDFKFSTAFNFEGNVKNVKIYNTALTDSELQALTT